MPSFQQVAKAFTVYLQAFARSVALLMMLAMGAGDCLEAGYDPPQSVVVLLDSELAEMEHTSTPSVRMPRGFELVWKDEGDRADRCLSIWRPVPFPGYAHPLLLYPLHATANNAVCLHYHTRRYCMALANGTWRI